MHTNHRRKNVYRPKHHHGRTLWLARSLKEKKQAESRLRRARERDLIVHERFEMLPVHYPRTIYWDYF